MKKQKKVSHFQYYYNELFSHHGVTIQNKNAKKFLITISVMDAFFISLLILLCIFKDSKIVYYFTDGSHTQYLFYAVMLFYACIALGSYAIYHTISYNYEKKHKHELLSKDIKGGYKLFSIAYKAIHFPWIAITCTTLKILEIFKIENLKDFIPMIVCGYTYFAILALIMLRTACKIFDTLIAKYDFLTNNLVNDTTYLYLIVFFTIVVCKHIPTLLLHIAIKPFANKNSIAYKRIFNQYHLLNYYILVVITLILKALNFTGNEKILIDALFYTTNALALFSTAKQKASNQK